jgi:hypothetical protein
MDQSDILTSNLSETNTDFTLREHYAERIKFHMTMLNYYLKEQKNDRMGN